MSFGGTVQAMIISLKNNARKRRKAFENWKDGKDIIHKQNKKLVFKKVSDTELDKIKIEISKNAKKERANQIILFFLLIIVSGIIIYIFINKYNEKLRKQELEKQKKYDKELIEKYQEKEDRIIYHLNIGYEYLNKGELFKAKKQFNNAYNIDDSDFKTLYALAKAFIIDCSENSFDCEGANKVLQILKKKFGNKEETLELENLLKRKTKL